MTGDMSLAFALAPLVVTAFAACLVLLAGVFMGARFRPVLTWLSVATLAAVVLLCALAWPQAGRAQPVLSDMWVADRMALVFDMIVALVGGMTLMVLGPFTREHGFPREELPALVLFAVAGMIMVVHATHLVSRRCRSRCGCPTPTRARPRRSPVSWPPGSRPRLSAG